MKVQYHGKRGLAKGQVWKTRAADIEIVALGKRLIHYRITKQLGRLFARQRGSVGKRRFR
jgi:hypothetical protein